MAILTFTQWVEGYITRFVFAFKFKRTKSEQTCQLIKFGTLDTFLLKNRELLFKASLINEVKINLYNVILQPRIFSIENIDSLY